MDVLAAAVTFVIGVGGVALGALLARQNERRAQGDRLLVEALDDAVDAITAVAGITARRYTYDPARDDDRLGAAQLRYASAVSRVALHGSPSVVAALRRFQDDATTATDEGRARLLAAMQTARVELGRERADDGDLAVLLFGGPL